MKISPRHIALLLACLAFTGCMSDDATKDYGFPVVYIPQATITGLDNSYPIPGKPFGQNSSYSCYFEKGSLRIALGVVRAGYISKARGFTVQLGASSAQTDRKLTELSEKGTAAEALPANICSIPTEIKVPDGDNTGTCYISLDLKKLAERQASLYVDGKYKLLVLGLEISSPSDYQLSETNTSVVIVLDLNSEHWDNVPENRPESEVRALFPIL